MTFSFDSVYQNWSNCHPEGVIYKLSYFYLIMSFTLIKKYNSIRDYDFGFGAKFAKTETIETEKIFYFLKHILKRKILIQHNK